MIYLASPFTHADPVIREKRYHRALDFLERELRAGHVVFSPIVYSFTICRARLHDLEKDWPFWRRVDFEFLRAAEALVVLKLDGWEESVGVREEIAEAVRCRMPVHYAEPGDLGTTLASLGFDPKSEGVAMPVEILRIAEDTVNRVIAERDEARGWCERLKAERTELERKLEESRLNGAELLDRQ